jgi:hypothetical protein
VAFVCADPMNGTAASRGAEYLQTLATNSIQDATTEHVPLGETQTDFAHGASSLEGMLLTEWQHGRPHKKLDQRQLKRYIFVVIVPSTPAFATYSTVSPAAREQALRENAAPDSDRPGVLRRCFGHESQAAGREARSELNRPHG